MQKRNIRQQSTLKDELDPLDSIPTYPKFKCHNLLRVRYLIIITSLLIIFGIIFHYWFTPSVDHMMKDLHFSEEEMHPVLIPSKPFCNVSIILSQDSTRFMDILDILQITASNTFHVQVLIYHYRTTNFTRYEKNENFIVSKLINWNDLMGDSILIIPENSWPSGHNDSWLKLMSQQFHYNDQLVILGSKILYNNVSPQLVYSAGLDVAISELDTPVLFNRYVAFNELDKRVMTMQSNIHGELGAVVSVARYGMMVRNDQHMSRMIFDHVDQLLSITNTDVDQFICLEHLKPSQPVILYYPIKDHAFIVDKKYQQSVTDDEHFIPSSDPHKSLLQSVIDQRLGEFKQIRSAWDFGAGSCTGWFMEAVNFVTALENRVPIRIITGRHDMCQGLPSSVVSCLNRLLDRTFQNITIFITHKPPDRYPKFPYNGLISIAGTPDYVIGRSMYESTTIPDSWAEKCNNKVDEVWVPSRFLQKAFIDGGVKKEKVFYIPEPIDHYFYDPDITVPLELQRAKYNFLSVFKWEERKAPQVLLEAYFKEFMGSRPQDVTLHLLTYIFMDSDGHSKELITQQVINVATSLNLTSFKNNYKIDHLPRVNIISQVIPTIDMPRLYKSMDAFVLPSRGEGWGMPYMEAMTMSLPTIAPNWGGQLEFMNHNNSYLIDVSMVAVNKWGRSREKWADPSITDLRAKMRYLYENREEGIKTGIKARQSIIERFSQKALADQVLNHFKRIRSILGKRKELKRQSSTKINKIKIN